MRLTQIPAPPSSSSSSSSSGGGGTSKADLLNSARRAYEWQCVKDIPLPFSMMYDLLMQRDMRLKRVSRFSTSDPSAGRTGWTLFVSEFSKQRAADAASAADRDPSMEGVRAMQSILKQASDAWQQMGKEGRAEYNERAKILAQQKGTLKQKKE